MAMSLETMRFVESAADLMPAAEMARMSGFEFIDGIRRGDHPAPPICKTLNYWLTEVEEGRVVFRGQPNLGAMNPIGSIHGGWFGTLLDSCMACAVQTKLPAGRAYTTLEYKVNVLRPLFADSGPIDAVGTAQHVGRRTGIAEGQMVGVDDGRLYATGSTTCLIFDL